MPSLDAPLGEEGAGQVKDVIADDTLMNPEDRMEDFFNKERAKALLDHLLPREQRILTMRYGLVDGTARTLAEIAKEIKVSRERVRQIEAAAIKKIKKMISEEKTDDGDR